MARMRRIWRTLERSLRKRGVVGSAVHVGAALARRVRGEGAAPAAVPTDEAEDRDFDTRYGVSTGGEIPQTELDVAEKNWIHGSAYVPTSPVDFAKVLSGHGLALEETTFIDLGAGKGRVLLMAAALPFRRVVGVEFSPSLADVARDNAVRYKGPRGCADIAVETMDATKYAFPRGPLAVFMYHPFDEKIMALVEANLSRSVREDPRRVVVIYFKPVHREVWDRSAAFRLVRDEPLYALYESGDRRA